MITFFKKTINYHYDNKNVENLDKLIYKIYDNDIDAVKNIIENQANILNLQDINGWTALIHAIQIENKELVELILSKSPDVNIGDKNGWTALIHAIIRKNKELVELILSKNPNVNIRDKNGWTALMHAIQIENKELVELILSKNPDVNIMDSDGYTAFDCANIYGINLQELINKVKSSKGN